MNQDFFFFVERHVTTGLKISIYTFICSKSIIHHHGTHILIPNEVRPKTVKLILAVLLVFSIKIQS